MQLRCIDREPRQRAGERTHHGRIASGQWNLPRQAAPVCDAAFGRDGAGQIGTRRAVDPAAGAFHLHICACRRNVVAARDGVCRRKIDVKRKWAGYTPAGIGIAKLCCAGVCVYHQFFGAGLIEPCFRGR